MTDYNSFKPQTAFEGYIKAQIESLFKAIEDTNGDISYLKKDVSDMNLRLGSIEQKVSGVKGWMLGVSTLFGILGGIVAVIIRGLI